MYSDKTIKSVADAARRIMEGKKPEVLNEALKGDQHKIDANKNGKIDSHDFELLRKKKKVEEEVELTESHFKVGDKVRCKESGMTGEVVKLDKDHGADDEKYYTVKKEDGKMQKFAPNELSMINEDLEEGMKTQVAPGRTRNIGTHGRAKGAEFGGTDWDKEESGKEDKPKRAKYGSRQNFVRSTRVNESFTDMLELYNEGGIKSLLESMHNKEIEIEEEATNDEFKAELDKAQAKSEGREKANVAQALVTATNQVDEEVELEERELTDSEMEKKEKYVKGMKKGLQGFKQRYGDRAKEVMYATATKQAKMDD